jgi:ubiquinone/menaquinone biosynthesis C-methylase UbiE
MREYSKSSENLLRTKISGGFWVDAGCGTGAYTIPLSSMADSVLAIDKNKSSLNYLENILITEKISNVSISQADFTNLDLSRHQNLSGILFAFSLHYQPNLQFLDQIFDQIKRLNFKIVIIEYTRRIPVPWVHIPVQ